jgi:hypothetical protein
MSPDRDEFEAAKVEQIIGRAAGANFNIDSAARDSYLALFNVSKILPFIRRAISEAGSGFWHSDSGLSQKLELGNISNRFRAAAPRQVSGSFT